MVSDLEDTAGGIEECGDAAVGRDWASCTCVRTCIPAARERSRNRGVNGVLKSINQVRSFLFFARITSHRTNDKVHRPCYIPE